MSVNYHETWYQGRKVIKKKKGRRQTIRYRRQAGCQCERCTGNRRYIRKRNKLAAMVEMADTGDLKSPAQ